MIEGPFGGDRPLLSLDCLLVVKEYTALSSSTISGGTSPDRTDEFQEAALSHLPVEAFSTESHKTDSDLFSDYLVAELDSDRLQLNRFMSFVEEYARLLNVDDRRAVNVGIDAKTRVQSRLPRPFADGEVDPTLLIEVRFPEKYRRRAIEQILNETEGQLEWVSDTIRSGPQTAILQHHSGPNDLVLSQVLQFQENLKQYDVLFDDVTVT